MKQNICWRLTILGAAVLTAFGLIATGCSTASSRSTAGSASKLPANSGGAQLWAQNCGHCHNIRSPGSYSDAQWDVVMLHMRVRANLTAEEHRSILAFLKSAH